MKITRIRIRNFRSIEELDLSFPSYYSALSGKNNSGKTNVVRSIRSVLPVENISPYDDDEEEVNYKRDFPSWKPHSIGKENITIILDLDVHATRDAGLFRYITTFLNEHIEEGSEIISVRVEVTHSESRSESQNAISINGKPVAEKIKQQELLKRLRSARFIYYHNSTESTWESYPRGVVGGLLSEFTADDRANLEKAKNKINKVLSEAAKSHQRDLTGILGKLDEKYNVGLSFPTFDFTYLPYGITLGDKSLKIPLKDWGSGTQNRTKILSTLLKSKHVIEGSEESDRITPVIIIEEPESFLHPSAQGEFGRILQDLSEEFQVQVITTTHSPYMLSLKAPASNVLLDRKRESQLARGTCRIETGGEDWMTPFGQALGIDSAEFAPWGKLFFKNADSILLVEGDTDEEYFKLLRDDAHGQNKLAFDGEIYAYGGCGNLQNQVLLSFMLRRYKNILLTFDLDSADKLQSTVRSLGLEENKSFFSIGVDEAGKKDIEGLLPETIKRKVYGENPSLVDAARGTQRERNDTRQQLKKLLLEAFRAEQRPGDEYYGNFYPLVKRLNKAYSKVR